MRYFPLLTAAVVMAVLYLVILQRDALVAFAAGETVSQADASTDMVADVSSKPPVSIVALRSTAQGVDSGLVLRGRTEAARHIEVRSEISGLVVSQPLRKGAFVKEGTLLCELDAGTRQAELAEAQARHAEAQANDHTSSALAESGFASETQVIARRAALESAEASVQRAEKEIARLRIVAPFSGLLESDTAEVGSLLQPGSLCGNVIQLDPIKLVGFVPETAVNQIELGSIAAARLIDGQTVSGEITFLSRSADPTTRTFRVEVEVANADLNIRDGSTAEIFIPFQGEKAHLLPQSALTLDDTGQLGIRTVKAGTALFLPVNIIRDSADGVWLAGLPPEVDVIIVGQEFVTDGRRVTVTFREPTE